MSPAEIKKQEEKKQRKKADASADEFKLPPIKDKKKSDLDADALRLKLEREMAKKEAKEGEDVVKPLEADISNARVRLMFIFM